MRTLTILFGFLVLVLMIPSAQAISPENSFASTIAIEEPEVVVDVKPDTLNLMSKGRYIMCYITPSEGYDARDIDISTIVLEGVSALPYRYGFIDINEDGICELMVKFDRNAIISVLPFERCDDYLMHIMGSYNDGIAFRGTDLIDITYSGRR
ncbi:MAG: hypothetical protein ACFFED_03010 [Candidatus Thorarchaeota archaeon]